jgi:hypothetical protein
MGPDADRNATRRHGLTEPAPHRGGDCRTILRDVPDRHGAGFFVWEPGWLPGVNATAEVGTTHGHLALSGLTWLTSWRFEMPFSCGLRRWGSLELFHALSGVF